MMLVAVSGHKDCGKTTLCRNLIASLIEMEFAVGYIKRTQEFVGSPRDTDSGSVSLLGCDSLLWGDDSFRYEAIRENACEADPRVVAGRYFPVADIVILEGGKNLNLPKIWVLGEGEAQPGYPGIFALYDRYAPGNGRERYGKDDLARLVSDIAAMVLRDGKSSRVYLNRRELPIKDFIADFIGGSVRGMLGSLKGISDEELAGTIRVYLREKAKD